MIPETSSQSLEMAAPSAFSYAQAAKGQGTAPPPSSPNPAAPAESPQAPDTAVKEPETVESKSEVPKAAPSAEGHSDTVEKQEKQEKVSVANAPELVSSGSVSGQRSVAGKDEETGRLERPWRRNDKGTRNSSTTTRSTDEADTRKSRKGRKGKSSEKPSGEQASNGTEEVAAEPEAPKIPLAEAPIPSVNIWQQRKQAQQAKVKPSPNATPKEPSAGAPAFSQAEGPPIENPSEPSKLADASEGGPDSTEGSTVATPVNGVKPQRKAADSLRPERNGSRGSRLKDKEPTNDVKNDENQVPPPVGDAISWPTPEISIKDQKKTTEEKLDRVTDKDHTEDGGNAKRQKDKWVHMPFTASASFQTPLPQIRGSKPRGGARGANGSRSSGGGNQSAEQAPSGSQQNKSGEPKDRPREPTNGVNGTGAGHPNGKRASVDVTNAREQKKPTGQESLDNKAKEFTPGQAFEQPQPTFKDRGEGRGDRGRGGGYRGRGGHHSVASYSQHPHALASTGGPSIPGAGNMAPRGHGPYSPPPRQFPHGQMFMPPPQRGGRGGGRNGTGANYHRLSLPNGRLPSVQTQFGAYDYPVQPMSAVPFQQPPYWDSVVFNMLRSQIDYYFSIENLCKDLYLRKRMDSQGFVPLHFIAAFKRVRELSGEGGLAMVRAACESSSEIDYVVGDDDQEHLRRRENWQQWLVRWDLRDEGARSNGPQRFSFKSRSYQYSHQYNSMPGMPYPVTSPLAYTMMGEQPFEQYMGQQQQQHSQQGYESHQQPNGLVSRQNSVNGAPKQLSADVPDFSPSGSVMVDQPAAASNPDSKKPETPTHANDDAESEAQPMSNGVHENAPEQAALQS